MCINSEELYLPFLLGGLKIGITDLYGNITFKFRNDTVLRMFELNQVLDPGVGYYNVEIEYPDFQIDTISSSVFTMPGPTIT